MSFADSFIALARRRSLFPHETNRVVVACSGGPDSLFLLYLLWAVREALQLELSVLTCDHGIRSEGMQEAHEVRQRAWTLGLPCQLHELDVPRHQRADESVEMAARRLRRKAYAETAADFGADFVALGHHMDDQAETILLKLARGTGPRGAGGMDWVTPLNQSVSLLRPLLWLSRAAIEEKIDAWGLKAIQDPSNAEPEYLRNRMRHEVLPLMCDRINPATVKHLAEFAEQQRKLEAWVSQEARLRGKGCVVGETLHLEPWRFLPEILQERILLGWLRERGSDLVTLGASQIRGLITDLNRKVTHARCWEVGTISIRADQDILSLNDMLAVPALQTLAWPGKVMWEPLHRPLNVSSADKVDLKASSVHDFTHTLTAFMKKPPPGEALTLRSPRPGDQYQPLGMKGRAKLSDLFINRHLPAKVRPVWPVVLCGNEIVWVPGFRVADQWRADQAECLKLEFR
ncbi:tRNA lysidine(34) synthetase TilS [Kiritimatiellaeota bacterium B1221]|nr:tRNA lysidine(34) synthetase TilS [Kiritimatiellaeota bacterium B1221]